MSSSKLMLLREFKELKSRPKSNYFQVYGLEEDNIYEWVVFIIGPPKTHYSGGIYKALMRFPKTYPMDPPSLQFVSNMYHPNVYRDGKVCISTLQVPPPEACDGELSNSLYWRPVIGVEQALLSVISLFSDPNLNDAANPQAASLWQLCPEKYQQKMTFIKEQSKKLVPEDFSMPIVLDPPETLKKDPETSEEQDEPETFVYSTDDNSEDSGDEDDVKSFQKSPAKESGQVGSSESQNPSDRDTECAQVVSISAKTARASRDFNVSNDPELSPQVHGSNEKRRKISN